VKPDGKPRRWKELLGDRQVLSWSLYDWANSAFATTVMAGFFPIFFKQYWSYGTDANMSTYQLGWANTIAAAALALLSPILGAIADQARGKKKILILFAFVGVLITGLMPLVAKGDWALAAGLYIVATIGFAGSCSIYDSLLIGVAKPSELEIVSALGYSLGYLGGGLLFALNVAMTLKPEFFGLADATVAVQLSFVTVAIWWALFSIPLLLYVPEPNGSDKDKPGWTQAALGGFKQVWATFLEIRKMKNVMLFLAAYFFYIDGVNTIIRMAVDYGLAIGLPMTGLIGALLLTQFVGFPAAILYGVIAHRIGPKPALYMGIVIYSGVTVFAYFMDKPLHFYILALVIGLAQGGIQSVSRSAFAQMVPQGKSGEYFGFYNMLGKFSSMMGPVLVGWVSLYTQQARLSVLSLIILFILGGIVLAFVPIKTAEARAAEANG
jgi:MFS transporter, UMF1 family